MKYTDTSESLSDSRDFQIVYRLGRSCACRTLVVYAFDREEKKRELLQSGKSLPHSFRMAGADTNRVGISVSRKVGNSVVRHHLCRLVRESYRIHDQSFGRGLDLVVVVRPCAREQSFSDIERALLSLSSRLGVLKRQKEYAGSQTGRRKQKP